MNIQAPRDFIDRRQLVSALRALRRGDFSVRLPEEVDGVDGEIASLFNEVVGLNEALTLEFRCERLVHSNDFVEEAGDFAVDTVDILREANAEVAAAERSKGADQLAAIDKVARGLDVHLRLRSARLPPQKVAPMAAPRLP